MDNYASYSAADMRGEYGRGRSVANDYAFSPQTYSEEYMAATAALADIMANPEIAANIARKFFKDSMDKYGAPS